MGIVSFSVILTFLVSSQKSQKTAIPSEALKDQFIKIHAPKTGSDQGAHIFRSDRKIALKGVILEAIPEKKIIKLLMNNEEVLIETRDKTLFVIACDGYTVKDLKPLDPSLLEKGDTVKVSIEKVLSARRVLADLVSTCRK